LDSLIKKNLFATENFLVRLASILYATAKKQALLFSFFFGEWSYIQPES